MRMAMALVLLGASGAVSAAPLYSTKPASTGSHLDAYYSNADVKVDGPGDADGDGGGLLLWMGNGIGLLTAEFQKNAFDVDDVALDVDTRQYRLGLGYRFVNEPAMQSWLRAEYVRLEADPDPGESDDQEGYGAHIGFLLGLRQFNGYAEVGVLDLEGMDGLEYKVGLGFQPGLFGAFVEYRATRFELDSDDSDIDYNDLRVGVRVAY
jgi:hypothetical protein